MAANGTVNPAQIPLPGSKLGGQAASAALYATQPEKKDNTNGLLDANGKLSSASAATSLKHADPRTLPSYPSSGLKKDDSAAGAAASIGWANQKTFEHWKPDAAASASASAAAMSAKDYKMAPSWQPEASSHGAKAALLAHKADGKVETWKPVPNNWGNSAATQAMANERKQALSPQLDHGHTDLGRMGSLMAATGAMSGTRSRQRADSTPVRTVPLYPDEANAKSNALKAATSVHKASTLSRSGTQSNGMGTSGANGAANAAVTNMSRDMYSSNPPVQLEVDEKRRNDTLRASAIAMAQQMYRVQQQQIQDATNDHLGAGNSAAIAAHGRGKATPTADGAQPMRFNSLQETAQRLAQERLAKLHNDHFEAAEYRNYYGDDAKPQQSGNRLSIRGRPRRRASSEGAKDEDKIQSQKIRQQMSLFSSNLSQVDDQKRKTDRDNLIAIAQRNVRESLHGMDEKVFADTGKVAPSLLSEWEVKAQRAAQANSDDRMANHGRVNIGGGKFISQSAVDLIARNNVQPTLDEINEGAATERARQDQLKHDALMAKLEADDKKQKEKEEKTINKQMKGQDKAEEKQRKADEKAAKEEQKRLAKEEKRKSGTKTGAVTTGAAVATPVRPEQTIDTDNAVSPTTDDEAIATSPVSDMTSPHSERLTIDPVIANTATGNKDATTPNSPVSDSNVKDSKVRHWLKTKFRRASRGQHSNPATSPPTTSDGSKDKGFVGGAAYTGASANNSTSSLPGQESVRSVALAGTGVGVDEGGMPTGVNGKGKVRAESVSSSEEGEFEEARDRFDEEELAPPRTFVEEVRKSSSPIRETRFHEVI